MVHFHAQNPLYPNFSTEANLELEGGTGQAELCTSVSGQPRSTTFRTEERGTREKTQACLSLSKPWKSHLVSTSLKRVRLGQVWELFPVKVYTDKNLSVATEVYMLVFSLSGAT